MTVKHISARQLKSRLESNNALFLLDVREPFEFNHARIENSVLIPLNQLPQRLQEIAYDKEIITICHHGMRSMQAANFLKQVGFEDISNLTGGIDAWSIECDSSVARY